MPPEKEISLVPQGGERVIFCSHFLRGFGLPASGFFRSFLDFYHLQAHHLTPNTVALLSAFVTMCEGYLGILPTIELWGAFFSPNWAPPPGRRRPSAVPSSRCAVRR